MDHYRALINQVEILYHMHEIGNDQMRNAIDAVLYMYLENRDKRK
jgi:hypothetical protein